jgi:hypothetical protein
MRLTRVPLAVICSACALLVTPAPAFAQAPKKEPRIPIVVVDARGVLARLGQDKTTAKGLSISEFDLPATGLGVSGGAHVYVWRGKSMAFGVGGEAILARGKHALIDSSGKKTGTEIDRRLRGVSGQLSLNFGHRDGWSYLTAGLGPTSFETYLAKAVPDGLRPVSLNFGGGARWFNWPHLAFTADLRFYLTKSAPATPNTAARLRKNVVVFSGGIAIK